ncbi:response regulator [bacterium]|nr:response regulator [bacterium]
MNDFEKLYRIFRAEALERIDELTQYLETLAEREQADRPEIYNDILRTAHNLKGAARTVGNESIEQLAHALEEAFLVSSKSEKLESGFLNTVHNAIDLINSIVIGSWDETDFHTIVAELRKISEIGSLSNRTRNDTSTDNPGGPSTKDVSGPDQDQPNSSSVKKSKTIQRDIALALRIDPSRLDQLLSYSGELLIAEARMALHHQEVLNFYKYVTQLKKEKPELTDCLSDLSNRIRPLVHNSRLDTHNFKYLTGSMTNALKKVRMIPLHEMTVTWRRIVQETCRLSGKMARLELQVGETELDKVVLDNLKDAFMHLLRNAVDHGIESPDDRVKQDKPEKGLILMIAQIEGNMIKLEISDDGQGLKPEKIGQAALKLGLITQEEIQAKSAQELLELVFLPGLSTVQDVSTLSGRGVGLNIVRNQISQLGGSIEISPKPTLGGTTFFIRIPISILSTLGLFVQNQMETYVLPIESVERTIRLTRNEIKYVDGQPTVTLEKQDPLRLFHLSNLFESSNQSNHSDKYLKIVILRHESQKLGLIVETIEGEKEFVAKRLPWNFHRVLGVNAVNIQADGSLSLVLDVTELFDLIKNRSFKEQLLQVRKSAQKQILVVDDSLTSRTLESNILKSAGYRVSVAVDGEEAWQKIQGQTFDLLVSDIKMPGLDGFELTKRLRRDPRFKDLPVILVTKLSRPEDIEAGVAAGADEYVVKGTFEQSNLLEMVARYL